MPGPTIILKNIANDFDSWYKNNPQGMSYLGVDVMFSFVNNYWMSKAAMRCADSDDTHSPVNQRILILESGPGFACNLI